MVAISRRHRLLDRVEILQADITTLSVDAIVNAANELMLGGGGVDGAIHRAAGPRLLDACRELPEVSPGIRCPTGESRITAGFALSARYVIHTVGPIWQGGHADEARLLASCYRSALQLACAHELRSIAFPAISCGVYGYPIAQAVTVVRQVLVEHLADAMPLERIVLVAFGEDLHTSLTEEFSS